MPEMNYGAHVECGEWKQVGAAVVCACGVLLYHGTIPRDRVEYAKALDELVLAVRQKMERGESKTREKLKQVHPFRATDDGGSVKEGPS